MTTYRTAGPPLSKVKLRTVLRSFHAAADEELNESPREEQRPSDPGVGCGVGNKPTPALRATPPKEGIFLEAIHARPSTTEHENSRPEDRVL